MHACMCAQRLFNRSCMHDMHACTIIAAWFKRARPNMAAAKRRKTRVHAAMELGVPNKALRRVMDLLASLCYDGETASAMVHTFMNPRAIEQEMEAEFGAMRQRLTLQTSDGPFEWEVGVPRMVIARYLETNAFAPHVLQALAIYAKFVKPHTCTPPPPAPRKKTASSYSSSVATVPVDHGGSSSIATSSCQAMF